MFLYDGQGNVERSTFFFFHVLTPSLSPSLTLSPSLSHSLPYSPSLTLPPSLPPSPSPSPTYSLCSVSQVFNDKDCWTPTADCPLLPPVLPHLPPQFSHTVSIDQLMPKT